MVHRLDKSIGASRSMREVLASILSLSRDFWTGATRGRAILLTAGTFGFLFAEIGMQVLINRWNKTFYDALEGKALDALWQAALWFIVLLVASTATTVMSQLSRLTLQIRWREQLTGKIIAAWLRHQTYYRLNLIGGPEFAPEARVAEDVRLAVEPIVDLLAGFVGAVITFATFVGILWVVGGSLTIGGVTIPGFMVWAAVVYSTIVSGAMTVVGWRYARIVRDRAEAEAQFRYQLTRLRENAESVALVRGEGGESRNLTARLATVIREWRRYTATWSYMTIVTHSSGLFAPILPVLLMVPKYLSGEASLGTVMQVATAFGTVQGALAWVTSNFAQLGQWYAAAYRVAELGSYMAMADHVGKGGPEIKVSEGDSDELVLDSVAVTLPSGKSLIADAAFRIAPGEMVMVGGKSGTGKSTLVRAIAGLWPWGRGNIRLPRGAKVAFLPQRPYLPIGSLKAAVTYPLAANEVSDAHIARSLELCALDYLVPRMAEEGAWDRTLSGGEQQRVAFCRLLVQRPSIVILDEATSALDEESQDILMRLFKTELADASVISVAHRPSLERYHTRKITLVREGGRTRTRDQVKKLTEWARSRAANVAKRGKQPVP